jgi:ABC-type transport system involved in multi-copper enzyme maturation permease subunit
MVRAFLGSELAERMKDDPESVRPAAWSMAFHYFFSYSQSWLLLLVVAIVGPPLIAQDVRSKAFLLYFSKPIDRATYLAGKAGVVLFYVWSVTLFPALVLYAISIAFSPSISAFVQTMGLMGQIGAVSLIIGVPATLIVLCFSSLTSDGRYATFGWITYWLLGEISYTLFSNLPALKNSEWVFLLSIRKTTSVLVEHVFNVSGQLVSIVGEEPRFRDLYDSLGAQYPALSAYVLLCAISAVCLAVVVRRISAPMRI